MSTDKLNKKKSKLIGWLTVGIVVLVFVGARQFHPGGIRGLLGDSITSAQTNPEIQAFHNRMLEALKPIGAGALCLKEHRDDADLRNAIQNYNLRNEVAMKELVSSIEAAGGMSRSEKDLLDRQAFREARSFVGKASEMKRVCNNLAKRLNSGEFDL